MLLTSADLVCSSQQTRKCGKNEFEQIALRKVQGKPSKKLMQWSCDEDVVVIFRQCKMFSSNQASCYTCSNNLCPGYRTQERVGGNECFPSSLWNQFSTKTVCFATYSHYIFLDCFYFLVLWEGDTKIIMLWRHEFGLYCCNAVTGGNIWLLQISSSLPFAMPAGPLPSCLPAPHLSFSVLSTHHLGISL